MVWVKNCIFVHQNLYFKPEFFPSGEFRLMIYRIPFRRREAFLDRSPFDRKLDFQRIFFSRDHSTGNQMMVRRKRFCTTLLWGVFLLLGPGCVLLPGREVQVPWMTKEELKTRLGSPNLIILDVRKKPDWDATSRKIPGAVHENYGAVKEWAAKYPPDKNLVLYCA